MTSSSYVNVTSEDWLFYWFFESKEAAGEKAPLMLWSNGGPGCSAMEGATTENGPMVLDMIKPGPTPFDKEGEPAQWRTC